MPQHRWPGCVPTGATPQRILYNGVPAVLDPEMGPTDDPVGWIRYYDADVRTEGVSVAKPGQNPTFWTVSPHFYAQLRARSATPPALPASPKVVVLPKQGIDGPRIEVTGLGRGGVASFKRAPNPALRWYLTRKFINEREYEAGLQLYYDFEDAQIPPGAVLDPTKDFVTGGGWQDFTPNRIDSLNRLRGAFAAVSGHTGRQMAFDVCCLGKMLVTQTYELYERRGSQTPRLREALRELSSYYAPYLRR